MMYCNYKNHLTMIVCALQLARTASVVLQVTVTMLAMTLETATETTMKTMMVVVIMADMI